MKRMLRTAVVLAAALALAGCAGLPTSGPVWTGRAVAEPQTDTDPIPIANGPIVGAAPELLVAGFLEAAISPADGWDTAREFLTPEFAEQWDPSAGVTIDRSASAREPISNIDDADEAEAGTVVVDLEQVASVDGVGAYSEAIGTTDVAFQLQRDADGEWRISDAPDGIVLDLASFEQVFAPYALSFFDLSWAHLVPDVRWFPKRSPVATRITRAVVESGPSEWLGPAVQSAFPADVVLARASVPVEGQVAEVALDRAALALDATALARMRTQLQASLKSINVNEVRFVVDGRELEAETVTLAEPDAETGTVVLAEDGLGSVFGGELTPINGIGDMLAELEGPVTEIDVAANNAFAAVQVESGDVWAVSEQRADLIDSRDGLIRPSVDPWGYVWTVPGSAPHAVRAITTGAEGHDVASAWPEASSISSLRVSSDGARVAAIITVGGHRSVVVAAVVRDESGLPLSLASTRVLTDIGGPATDLSWVGADAIAVLIDDGDARVLTQPVGGPRSVSAAPAEAVSLAGAPTRGGVRILGENGALFTPRASVWQEYFSGVLVLGTRAGY